MFYWHKKETDAVYFLAVLKTGISGCRLQTRARKSCAASATSGAGGRKRSIYIPVVYGKPRQPERREKHERPEERLVYQRDTTRICRSGNNCRESAHVVHTLWLPAFPRLEKPRPQRDRLFFPPGTNPRRYHRLIVEHESFSHRRQRFSRQQPRQIPCRRGHEVVAVVRDVRKSGVFKRTRRNDFYRRPRRRSCVGRRRRRLRHIVHTFADTRVAISKGCSTRQQVWNIHAI